MSNLYMFDGSAFSTICYDEIPPRSKNCRVNHHYLTAQPYHVPPIFIPVRCFPVTGYHFPRPPSIVSQQLPPNEPLAPRRAPLAPSFAPQKSLLLMGPQVPSFMGKSMVFCKFCRCAPKPIH